MTGRYELLDSDEHRLPEGMSRVGYDADTEVYTYQDADGSFWEGEEGNRYGVLHRAGSSRPPRHQMPGVTPAQRYDDWRYLLPFFLVVGVVLLLVFRLVNRSPEMLSCEDGLEVYTVLKGDTCWNIATARGSTVDSLREANHGLDCDRLTPGRLLCTPTMPT